MESVAMRLTWLFVVAVLALPLTVAATPSTEASAQLHQALLEFDSIQGAFTQKQYAEDGELLEQSSGMFAVLRPGFFRWEINHPDSQLIVVDPHFLWHHDRDLETVTRRPATSSGQMAPLRILAGSRSALEEAFAVSRSAQGDFVLQPLEAEAGFQQVSLVFHEGRLSRMNVTDELGQIVTIEFFEVDSSTPLTPDDFAFTPPADADLFYYDE